MTSLRRPRENEPSKINPMTKQILESTKQEHFRIAVQDDYQHVALSLADWSVLDRRATVTVFDDHLADSDAVIERLRPFDIVCAMRERTPMTRTIIERLPKLRLIASTAPRNASIDLKAAEERGVQVVHTGYTSASTIELTWALILGSARNLVAENASLRSGGWQRFIGDDMAGRTLGVLGLGNVGGPIAQIGRAFGMNVIAWSQNLTAGIGGAVGMESVQIARKLGASLAISTASTSAKAEKAQAHGYEHVIDLSRESLRDGVMRLTGGRGVDVIIDGVGGKLTGEALGCLLPGGTYAVVGYAGGREASVNLTDIIWKAAKVRGFTFRGFAPVVERKSKSFASLVRGRIAAWENGSRAGHWRFHG
jgi:Zinc-binding dehydrogenase/D-isomer specific 2-hydroxyacid dehydrogenase, catalytic domain